MKFHISRDQYMFEGCMLHIAQDLGDKYGVLKLDEVEIETMDKHSVSSHPLQMNHDDAQRLLEALWEAGYRPNHGESSLAHVDAIKFHLEDMRKIAFRRKP